MNRLTDNDKHLFGGWITYGNVDWNAFSISLSSSGDDEDDDEDNYNILMVYVCNRVLRLRLPPIIQPHKEKVIASTWDDKTISRLGKNWYYNISNREYGFRLSDGFLTVYYGRQPRDGDAAKNCSWFLPWTQWRFISTTFYDTEGKIFAVEGNNKNWSTSSRATLKDVCPSVQFEFVDYDGERIVATTLIEERRWLFGEGWFKWLSLFKQPLVRKSLDLSFSSEIGTEKGSWKGGTVGHSIEMLPGELHEDAFKRYCANGYTSRRSKISELIFVSRIITDRNGVTNDNQEQEPLCNTGNVKSEQNYKENT